MKIYREIKSLQQEIEELTITYIDSIFDVEKKNKCLIEKSNTIVESWAGNWFEYPNRYENFIDDLEEYILLDYENIYKFVCENTQIDLKKIEVELNQILEIFKSKNDNLITELSIIKSSEKFSKQLPILEKLENYDWGYSSSKIIEAQTPKKYIGDYNIAQKIIENGFEIPPHLDFSAKLISLGTIIMSMREYLKTSKRILREVEILTKHDDKEDFNNESSVEYLNKIFDNFHDVARLLINRHSDRETLIINDEYDVQDLLRSLLKIFFDDIRPEEFSPSYAGRNTRIDFLLKKEKIIIEVKKTRKGLKDKEIGDELLQDISRYKNHPDCEILYCFVYDPQGFVMNPRGLENDLSSESTEKMTIYVNIKP